MVPVSRQNTAPVPVHAHCPSTHVSPIGMSSINHNQCGGEKSTKGKRGQRGQGWWWGWEWPLPKKNHCLIGRAGEGLSWQAGGGSVQHGPSILSCLASPNTQNGRMNWQNGGIGGLSPPGVGHRSVPVCPMPSLSPTVPLSQKLDRQNHQGQHPVPLGHNQKQNKNWGPSVG